MGVYARRRILQRHGLHGEVYRGARHNRGAVRTAEGHRLYRHEELRGELQYLYSPHHEGQWFFALYELSLFRHWTLSGEWLYNIGYAPDATNRHYYTAGLTFPYNAHRAMLAYTKTREGFNCSGGICRYVPQQQGISLSYSFTW